MFWTLFVFFILIGCVFAYIFDLFEQMKTSEYEIVRIIYWILVVSFWVYVLVWLINF